MSVPDYDASAPTVRSAAASTNKLAASTEAAAGAAYPEIMTIEQVADYLQLHPQVVYRHVRAGTLPASRIGRTIRFKKSILDAFLENDAWAAAGKFLAFVERTEKRNAPVLSQDVRGSSSSVETARAGEPAPQRRYAAEADYVD